MQKLLLGIVLMAGLSACATENRSDLSSAMERCDGVWEGESGASVLRACSQVIERSTMDADVAAAYNSRGVLHRRSGRFEAAVADFNESIRYNPESSTAHSNRGIAYAQMGLDEPAVESFSKALLLNPRNETAYNNYSWFLSVRGEYEEALAKAEKAREIKFDDEEIHDTLAHALMGLGRQEEAQKAFEVAASFGGPDMVRGYQKALRAKGYYRGSMSGTFDDATREALAACIRENCRLMLD